MKKQIKKNFNENDELMKYMACKLITTTRFQHLLEGYLKFYTEWVWRKLIITFVGSLQSLVILSIFSMPV